MAGRCRSKSDGSADSFVGFIILLVIGWIILHWQLVLSVIAFGGVAVVIFFCVKLIVKNALYDKEHLQQHQQNHA